MCVYRKAMFQNISKNPARYPPQSDGQKPNLFEHISRMKEADETSCIQHSGW